MTFIMFISIDVISGNSLAPFGNLENLDIRINVSGTNSNTHMILTLYCETLATTFKRVFLSVMSRHIDIASFCPTLYLP